MTLQRIHCPALPEPAGATWSNALRIGDELIISGVTAHPAASAGGPGQHLATEAQALNCLRKIGLLAVAALVRPELRIEIDATIRLDARRSTLAL